MTRIGGTIVTVVALMLTPIVSAEDVVPPGQQQETALPGMTAEQDKVAGSMADQALAVMQAKEAAMRPPTARQASESLLPSIWQMEIILEVILEVLERLYPPLPDPGELKPPVVEEGFEVPFPPERVDPSERIA